jgi:hypothetical protein
MLSQTNKSSQNILFMFQLWRGGSADEKGWMPDLDIVMVNSAQEKKKSNSVKL